MSGRDARTLELVRQLESGAGVESEHIPDMTDFARELRARAYMRAELAPERRIAKGKLKAASLGGKATAEKKRAAAREEADAFASYCAQRPRLSRSACARMYSAARGDADGTGRSLLRRVARARKVGPRS
jgi:hypothetical protein